MLTDPHRTAGSTGESAAVAVLPDTSTQQDGRPSPVAVREHLVALLGDANFQTSERRKKLLAYVVEQTLDGRGDRLKGFDLAVAVLGRDERFDPQTDPIVRVEVGKLRRDLEHYYLTAGASHTIRIEIPKGHNAATFHDHSGPPTPTIAITRPRLSVPQMAWLGLGLDPVARRRLCPDDTVESRSASGDRSGESSWSRSKPSPATRRGTCWRSV